MKKHIYAKTGTILAIVGVLSFVGFGTSLAGYGGHCDDGHGRDGEKNKHCHVPPPPPHHTPPPHHHEDGDNDRDDHGHVIIHAPVVTKHDDHGDHGHRG